MNVPIKDHGEPQGMTLQEQAELVRTVGMLCHMAGWKSSGKKIFRIADRLREQVADLEQKEPTA